MKIYNCHSEEDLTFDDLMKLKKISSCLPSFLKFRFRPNKDTDESFDDYFYRKSNEFFNEVTAEEYKKIEGKCFISPDKTDIIKVYQVDEKSEHPENFLYERFELCGYDWYPFDSNWLQSTAEYDANYQKYCLTPYTDQNINSENMFMLGKDGKLYVDMSCGGDYMVYKPCSEKTFQKAREEAIKNVEDDKEPSEEDYLDFLSRLKTPGI